MINDNNQSDDRPIQSEREQFYFQYFSSLFDQATLCQKVTVTTTPLFHSYVLKKKSSLRLVLWISMA